MRKDLLVTDSVYHIFNKSIAGYKIFNNNEDYSRIVNVFCYYQREKPGINFSKFISAADKNGCDYYDFSSLIDRRKHVEIIAYCVMPTHFHIILKQVLDRGISIFMNNIQNSYTRYFNIKNKRKGPLWESRFKSVLVEKDEQLLHLTRYLHLNPVTAFMVDKPEDWKASSYQEYIFQTSNSICEYDDLIEIDKSIYKEFVEDRISYQRGLSNIKDLLYADANPTA